MQLRAVPASTATLPAGNTLPRSTDDPYTQLAELCGAQGPVAVSKTVRGRGLVLQEDMPAREALLTVQMQNTLIIADEPTSGISIFSDRQHRRWQELHGELPPLLLEFLQGKQCGSAVPQRLFAVGCVMRSKPWHAANRLLLTCVCCCSGLAASVHPWCPLVQQQLRTGSCPSNFAAVPQSPHTCK